MYNVLFWRKHVLVIWLIHNVSAIVLYCENYHGPEFVRVGYPLPTQEPNDPLTQNQDLPYLDVETSTPGIV